MAPPVKTVGGLVADVAEIVANTATPQTSLANRIKAALNAAQMEWYNKCRPSCLHKQTTFATVAGQIDYPLADDFGLMVDTSGVWCAATPFTVLRYITMQEYIGKGYHNTDQSADPPLYYCLPESVAATGAQLIRVSPKPSAVRTIAYRYVAMPAAIDAAADATNLDVRIPSNLHHGFVWGAVTFLPDVLADQTRVAVFGSLWRQFLSDSRSQSNRIIGGQRQKARYDYPHGYVPPDPTVTVVGTADS